MILWAKSKNGKMIKVGDSSEASPWRFMTTEVMNVIGNFNSGDEVTIEIKKEGASEFVTKITKGNVVPTVSKTPDMSKPVNASAKINTGANPDSGVIAQKTPYLPKDEWIAQQKAKGLWKDTPSLDKGADVNSSIKKQAIAHATSRTIVGMQGTITPDNVCEVIKAIYKTYQELVG